MKMRLSKDHQELLSALNDHNVLYVVVGGYAVGAHAEPRATKDLDVFIRPDEANSHAVFKALAAFGAPLAGFTPNDFNDGRSVFHMGQPPERIDVLQQLDGVSFDETWRKREVAVVNEELAVPIIGIDELIRNKLAAGRPRDLLDVAELREAQAAENDAT